MFPGTRLFCRSYSGSVGSYPESLQLLWVFAINSWSGTLRRYITVWRRVVTGVLGGGDCGGGRIVAENSLVVITAKVLRCQNTNWSSLAGQPSSPPSRPGRRPPLLSRALPRTGPVQGGEGTALRGSANSVSSSDIAATITKKNVLNYCWPAGFQVDPTSLKLACNL